MTKMQCALWIMVALCAAWGCNRQSASVSKTSEADAQKAAANQDPDFENIKGTWKIVSSEWDGEPNPKAVGNFFTFDGASLKAWLRDIGDVTLEYKIDPSKQPKHMTVKLGRPPNDMIYSAIYELNGDTLKVCFRERDRPTGFKTEVGTLWTSHVLERSDDLK